MKKTKITVTNRKISGWPGDVLTFCVEEKKKQKWSAPALVQEILSKCAGKDDFSGAQENLTLLYPPFGTDVELKCSRLLLVGLGELALQKERTNLHEILRIAGGRIAAECRRKKLVRIGIVLPECKLSPEETAENLTEGLLLADYAFERYKTDKEAEYKGLQKVEFLVKSQAPKIRKGVVRAQINSRAVCTARDMANEPGNGWTPTHFADYAKKICRELSMKCTVLDRSHMGKIGMGGILAVNQGSKEPPKLVMVDYNPGGAEQTLLLVGKGLTFDSGGVSLKPGKGMMDMKYDMCGGAAVLATMEAVGKLKPGIRVVGIIPATDNMAGGGALKPGDIIRHYGGITSEIENTDAEGRLILADSIAWGIEQVNPTAVIDLATLTGAVIIALGHHYTGLLSNNDSLASRVIDAGKKVGEPVWRLPLGPQFVKQLESRVADMKNSGGRPGGTITAAEYLHRFAGKTPWVHLDIAGTAWDFTEKSYIPKGPSGIGVRTLLQRIRNWKKGKLN